MPRLAAAGLLLLPLSLFPKGSVAAQVQEGQTSCAAQGASPRYSIERQYNSDDTNALNLYISVATREVDAKRLTVLVCKRRVRVLAARSLRSIE